jgi:HrpA-like RNA helicase
LTGLRGSPDSDFLLICLKQLLTHRDDVRVIIMSATLHADLFSNVSRSTLPRPLILLPYPHRGS